MLQKSPTLTYFSIVLTISCVGRELSTSTEFLTLAVLSGDNEWSEVKVNDHPSWTRFTNCICKPYILTSCFVPASSEHRLNCDSAAIPKLYSRMLTYEDYSPGRSRVNLTEYYQCKKHFNGTQGNIVCDIWSTETSNWCRNTSRSFSFLWAQCSSTRRIPIIWHSSEEATLVYHNSSIVHTGFCPASITIHNPAACSTFTSSISPAHSPTTSTSVMESTRTVGSNSSTIPVTEVTSNLSPTSEISPTLVIISVPISVLTEGTSRFSASLMINAGDSMLTGNSTDDVNTLSATTSVLTTSTSSSLNIPTAFLLTSAYISVLSPTLIHFSHFASISNSLSQSESTAGMSNVASTAVTSSDSPSCTISNALTSTASIPGTADLSSNFHSPDISSSVLNVVTSTDHVTASYALPSILLAATDQLTSTASHSHLAASSHVATNPSILASSSRVNPSHLASSSNVAINATSVTFSEIQSLPITSKFTDIYASTSPLFPFILVTDIHSSASTSPSLPAPTSTMSADFSWAISNVLSSVSVSTPASRRTVSCRDSGLCLYQILALSGLATTFIIMSTLLISLVCKVRCSRNDKNNPREAFSITRPVMDKHRAARRFPNFEPLY